MLLRAVLYVVSSAEPLLSLIFLQAVLSQPPIVVLGLSRPFEEVLLLAAARDNQRRTGRHHLVLWSVVTLGSKTSVEYPLRYLRYSTEPNQLLVLEWLRVGGVRLPTNKQHHLYGLATTVLLPDRWTQK